ncbi:hypothetical protein MMC20_007847 [Loxospora ochrophaea]|nr:hypothetical protein [Loxospora ochrophaea]
MSQPTAGGGLAPISIQPPPPALPPLHPPQHHDFADDDISSPIHYTRDPRRLIAYLVPFPRPENLPSGSADIPARFLIYTPPPPPLSEPSPDSKEGKVHKVQRKWQNEVRTAKQSTAKTASWKGVKSKATKGISWAMGQVKSADLEFLNRISGDHSGSSPPVDSHADDGHRDSGDETHRTVGLEQMVLIYPPSLGMSEEQVRAEFVASMMRTKTKAQKDAVLATGLIPVSAAIDVCATLVWPFGGLLEIDSVWAYASIRGAKTARSVTKRLTSTENSSTSGQGGSSEEPSLQLSFTSSPRLELLRCYLASKCCERDGKIFSSPGVRPTETEILEAIGWSPAQNSGEERNWEDEQWQITEVKEDLKAVMQKGARAWDKWVKAFEKDPEKALKK